MKKFYYIFILFFLIICCINPLFGVKEKDCKIGTINIIITGFNSDDGKALIGLYNTTESFPNADKAYQGESVTVNKGIATAKFKNIPYGTYAIAFIHDNNNSGKMEYSLFGIPLKGFGFSNNAKASMSGPPSFNSASFSVNVDNVTQNMTVNYM